MRIPTVAHTRRAVKLTRTCITNDSNRPISSIGVSLFNSGYQGRNLRVALDIPRPSFSRRSFSDASHDDFAPKRKAVSGEDEAMDLIKQHVQENKVMLYMKGNPSMPMCGFSSRVVQVLKAEGVDFASVNVLDYPAIREGIKKYSDWPTIPQLYVDGEFVGGCDIVTAMHESGELKELLSASK